MKKDHFFETVAAKTVDGGDFQCYGTESITGQKKYKTKSIGKQWKVLKKSILRNETPQASRKITDSRRQTNFWEKSFFSYKWFVHLDNERKNKNSPTGRVSLYTEKLQWS